MGVSMVISLCCDLCRLLPRELLQGFWCRHDRHDVPLVCDSSLLPWGLLRVILMSCIACLCGSACLHVTSLSDLAVSPILCPWSFQRILNVHGSLSGLKAKHLYMWFFLTAAVLVTCSHSCRFVFSPWEGRHFSRWGCPQDWSFLLWCNYHGVLLSPHQEWSVEATRSLFSWWPHFNSTCTRTVRRATVNFEIEFVSTVVDISIPAGLRWKVGQIEGTHGWMPTICWKRLSVPCLSRKSVQM